MKKSYKFKELDCANCAAKIETKIKKIKGVQDATVAFLTKKVTITANEEDFDRIIPEAQKIVKKTEPDCELIVL